MSLENKSADENYQEACLRWSEIVDLSLDDDKSVLHNATMPLRKALELDPNHVASLKLLSSILMENDFYEEAERMLQKLIELEPEAMEHQQKLALLESRDRNQIKDYVESKLLIPGC